MVVNDLISVIVPAYNCSDRISECLNSLCSQTYKNLEIIVVYLDSQDYSLNLIKSFVNKDERICLLEQKDKTGPGGARNIGLDYAHGKWIGFTEADDQPCADFYEKLLQEAIRTDADIVQGNIVLGGKPWTKYKDAIYSKLKDKYSLIENGASFDKIFKTDLIRNHNIRFTEKVRYEDNPFIFKAFYYAHKIATVSGAVYNYNPDAKGGAYKKVLEQSVIPVVRDIVEFVESTQHTNAEKRIVKHKILDSFAQSHITEPTIYHELSNLLGNPLILKLLYCKKIFKKYKRKIFHLKGKEK